MRGIGSLLLFFPRLVGREETIGRRSVVSPAASSSKAKVNLALGRKGSSEWPFRHTFFFFLSVVEDVEQNHSQAVAIEAVRLEG